MKFSNEHFTGLKKAIKASMIDLAKTRKQYQDKNLSDTRFLWDIFWASNYHKEEDFRNSHYLDSHIQTAIKNAVKELELEEDINTQKNELSEKIEAGIATDAEIDKAMQKEFEFAAKYFKD